MLRNRMNGRVVKRKLLLESLENRRVFDAAMTLALDPSIGQTHDEPAISRLLGSPVELVSIDVEEVSRPDDVSKPGPDATPLPWTGNGTWIDGILDSGTDIDAFQVTLPGMTEFTISVGTDTEATAAQWQLLDANYQEVGSESSDFGKVYTNLSAGNYFLVVQPLEVSETPIRYWVNGNGTRLDDPSSLDDTATVMTLDWGIGGTIDGENDVDAFQVKLPDTESLTIYASHDENATDWSVTLHQADGSVVTPTPAADGQDTFASRYDSVAGGLYYVVVKGSAAAKSDYWISAALNQPIPLPWVRSGIEFGVPMEIAGSLADGSVADNLATDVNVEVVTASVMNEFDDSVKTEVIPADDLVPVELRNSDTSVDPDDVIFQTLDSSLNGEVTTQESDNPLDLNKDGVLTAADVLVIIHHLNLSLTEAVNSESASSLRVASFLAATDLPLDVNDDGGVSAADALLLINRMVENDYASWLELSGGQSDGQSIAIDEPFVSSDEGAKELALADVGSFGVVYLQIDDQGELKAEADGEPRDVAVGTDGSLSIGDELLPAHLATSSSGEALLVTGYVPSSENSGGDLLPGRPQIDTQALLEAAIATAKSLALADVGDYGVVTLVLESDGSLVVTANDSVVKATVDEQGKIFIGELPLHAVVYTSLRGEKGLFSEFDPLLNPEPPSDLLIPSDSARLAGYTVMTLVGPNDRLFVVSVDEDNALSAISDGKPVDVVINDEETLVVDGVKLPVIIRRVGDNILLLPADTDSGEFVMSWTDAVDDVMSQFA